MLSAAERFTVAADHELAERRDDLAGMPAAQDEAGGADVHRQPEEREQEQNGRETREVERPRALERDQEDDDRGAEGERQEEVDQDAREGHDQQRQNEQNAERSPELGVPCGAGSGFGRGSHGIRLMQRPCHPRSYAKVCTGNVLDGVIGGWQFSP